MAPLGRRMASSSSAIGLRRAALLTCLIFVSMTRATPLSQADEDLIFEEDGGTRTRREIEVAPVAAPLQETPTNLLRERRQSAWSPWASSDDEDDYYYTDNGSAEEGSGSIQHIYRAKIHVLREFGSAYSSMATPTARKLANDVKRALEAVLAPVSGNKVVTVSRIGRSNANKLLVTCDINYEGFSDEEQNMRNRIKRSLESQYLGAIPVNSQYFTFEEPKATAPATCPTGKFQCPSGRCVIPCDGKYECLDASDEDNCPETGSSQTSCRSDDQGPYPCDDGVTRACFCDGTVQCPSGEDELESRCDTGCGSNQFICDGSCHDNSERCDGVDHCFDGADEANCPSTSTIGTPVLPVVTSCRSDDQGPYPCDDGVTRACFCDGTVQCPSGEDELESRCDTGCGRNQFSCDSGTCHDNAKKCDGFRDCFDDSDEENCFTTPTTTTITDTPTPPGPVRPSCRLASQGPRLCNDGQTYACFCDGRRECWTGEDEQSSNCRRDCRSNEHSCDDGTKCIEEARQCDNFQDCYDGTDEQNCPTSPLPCQNNEFRCNTGECIPYFRQCDFMTDCPGGEDELTCPCRTSEYQCISGQCISGDKRCDRVRDCDDGSDEDVGCPGQNCPEGEFTCNDGQCINMRYRCDGQTQCRDRSDEEGCPTVCRTDEFRCRDNTCININQRCNGRSECRGGEDEVGCPTNCQPDEWRCLSGDCILSTYRCDGRQDCRDNSDETVECRNPPPPPTRCSEDELECGNGVCVLRSLICDGIPDCVDGRDEQDCPTTPCPGNQFACSSGECIDSDKRCSGRDECSDGSDEYECPVIRNCSQNEFRCAEGGCISKEWRCDSVPDCSDASDEEGCQCEQNEYRCNNGQCIPEYERCDGTYDCSDGSDERDQCCEANEFTCSNGDCIPASQRCNGYSECRDESDEDACEFGPCTANEFSCGSGECVSSRVVCDGRFDCSDMSDEDICEGEVVTARPASCSVYQFRCGGGFCIDEYQRCDGRADCQDGSDERGCDSSRRCQPYEFQCRNGLCISKSAKCDGRRDCLDGSDEIDCNTPPPLPRCQPYEFQCSDGQQCVSQSVKCDSRRDCNDGSDEWNCPDVDTPPPPSNYFVCRNGRFIEGSRRCDGRLDCDDGSDEDERCGSSTDTIDLRTYPDEQTIQQTREVVFQCRDEGTLRSPVRWVRDGNRPLPPGTTDVRGRLTIPNIQIEHSGRYICEANGVPPTTPGRTKSVNLQVTQYVAPTQPPKPPACSVLQATCNDGQCIPRDKVCNNVIDCADGSDETRCNPFGCEPNEYQCDNKRCVLKTWRCDSDDDCGDGSDERECVTNHPDDPCHYDEFTCYNGDQCIPKSFHCDSEVDCQDGSDEEGCSRPTIIEPPQRNLTVHATETFTLTCRAIGVPTPMVLWRLNWGHVPAKCTMTSVDGRGELVCPDATMSDQGAYSCEAITSKGSVFAQPDAIVYLIDGPTVCQPPQFNAEAVSKQDCLNCFCFGATDQCYSSDRYITQLPPPSGDKFQLIGVNQDQFQGNYVIRNRQYPLSSRFLHEQENNGIQLRVDRTKLGGPRDLLVYFSLPSSHKGQQLASYNGYLRYTIQYSISGSGQALNGPDVIMTGNNVTLMYVHEETFRPGERNQVDVRIGTGHWYKRLVGRGRVVQKRERASREEIMMVLENMELLLIRAMYNDEIFARVTLSNVQMETAVFTKSDQGRAVFVEDCRCPEGYLGLSCQDCASTHKRVREGPWLGRCVPDADCGPGEYGDPSRGIACLPCPCPLTTRSNQFSSSCYLDTDGEVTCNCQQGYSGRRCESCSPGYEGNPNRSGESCQPAGECNPIGSRSSSADPSTGLCFCKEFTAGPKCDTCTQNSFYLNNDNQYGCIPCFCMGITEDCTSSTWYRQQETVSFTNDRQSFELVDKFQQTVISNEIFVDSGRQELVFREFSRLGQEVYYWKLPQRFLGDKVTSYGGNLTYNLRYVPAPGGLSSANAAAAVEIYGNDIVLKHYSKSQLRPNIQETVSVPLYEQYWERQDGQEANREHFLMALADLEYVLIKATYTTNTREVGLKEVILDFAESRNTGQERAFAVEMCECPQGYQGLSCEDCAVGYTRSLSGLHLGTCIPCECSGHSEECDPEDGVCMNCRDNTAGDYCDECALGFNRDSATGRCIRLDGGDCNCDPRGSISTQCYRNRCQCKNNVRGEDCSSCLPGYFHLSERNQDGCLQCWCSGVSTQCFSSNYYRTQLPMQLLTNHGFTLSNRLRSNIIKDGLQTTIANNEISFSDFGVLRDVETYYWSLPQMFTGNRLTSYGGNLTITQRYQAQPGGNRYADPDVIIRSSGGRELIWMNNSPLQPNALQSYTVPLFEENFTMNQQPASRSEFLNALSSIEAILVRATLSDRMSSTYLRDVIMDTAVPSPVIGQARAFEVEQCQCPKEYLGLSCEHCKPGYYRDTASNQCNRCPCNGHEESCALGADGRVRCNCLREYYGENCEGSGPRPESQSPTVSVRISTPSIQIKSVGSTVEFRCSAQSQTESRNRVPVTWSKYGGELPYGRAEDNRQGLLVISQVRVSDSGVYVCRASDGYTVFTQNATLRVEGGQPQSQLPRVRIDPQRDTFELALGQNFEVRCITEGSPRPQVTWSYGQARTRLPFNVFQDNGVLTFRNVQSSVSGEYYCTATNNQGINDARIIINAGSQNTRPEPTRPTPGPGGPVIIVQVSQEFVEIRAGETVRVSCSADNSEVLKIEWNRSPGSLPSQAVVSNGELQIVNARPADSGIYVCRITNVRTGSFGETSTRISISQSMTIPTVRIQPDRQTINQGTNAELRCIASGDPTPVVTWTKVNEEFGPGISVDGSTLRIRDAVVSDRGMYLCSAQNEGGTAQAAAIVEVERREPPVIEVYPEVKQTIVVGASALFQCHLTAGIPNPSVQWTRADGRPLTPNTETLNGGVLRFNQVKGDEEGSYTCTAENDAGSVSAIAILEIQSLPLITIRPGPSPYRVVAGQHVRLECSAEGDPAPTVSWQKLQIDFPTSIPSKSVTPTVAVYEIASVSRADDGTYQCSARNAAGVNEERLQLVVEESGEEVDTTLGPSRPGSPNVDFGHVDTYPLGTNVVLDCRPGEGQDDIQITITRADRTPLPQGYRIENGILFLTNVDYSAAGEYVCMGTDKITGTILFTHYHTIKILARAPPLITLNPARQIVRPGDRARIQCTVTGSQPITINWSREGGYMPPSVVINGGDMMFRGIETTDAGRYICEAVNSAGNARSLAEVVVNEETILTAIQQDMLVYVGQTAELRCEASGINDAAVTWTRVGARLPPRAEARGSVLKLSVVQPEDSGKYQCQARTEKGIATSDFITLTVERGQQADISIVPSRRQVRIGDELTLACRVRGDPAAAVSWSRDINDLPANAQARGSQLILRNVQADNGGVYRCFVTTPNGVFEESYALAVQGVYSYENVKYNGVTSRSVQTRSVQFGDGVRMECHFSLAEPVSYTWSKQGGDLPVNALVQDSILDIRKVHIEDAGLYICTGSNAERSVDLPTLLTVTGVIPRFTGEYSYLTLSTLSRAYLTFDLEISFKPEAEDGLILYNSQRAGNEDGDFVSFGMSGGHAEFRFDVGSGPAIIRSRQPLELNEWHTVKLMRNRKEGTMIVDDGQPATGHSVGRFLGLDLVEDMYLGSVPDFSNVHKQTGFSTGFRGCISRLVIRKKVTIDLTRNAKSKVGVQSCDTCDGNPCQNSGVCQEAYTERGHKCICPAGFSGGLCENTGEACYPGVCGIGRCVNKPGGFECFCPFGKSGERCEQDITIVEPAFGQGAYIAYPTPRALRHFSVDLNFKPESLNDGVLMYCAQRESGEGDFTSLAIRNKRLEFRFNTGSGTAILQSDPIQEHEWMEVRANRTDRLGSMAINGGSMQNTESPGSNRGLNLVTPLFIGGVDKSRIEISPEVGVNHGFQGCVKQIKLMDQDVRLADALVDSANVGQCGGASGSMCLHNPCANRGQCLDDPSSPHGYSCSCNEGYSGRDCEIEPGVCSIVQPCKNGGSCVGSRNIYSCRCPLGFSGQHCEHVIQVRGSASFAGDSWAEFNQSLLPQEGGATQKLFFEFSTVRPEGLLFWLGQAPGTAGRGQDYISVSIKNGFVEFNYQLGTGPGSVRSPKRVDDGERHVLSVKRTGRQGSIELDGSVHEHGQSPGILHMLNAKGNIYIGGVPDLRLMTAGAHSVGFQGCIHQLTIGDEKIIDYMNTALSGVNVSLCPSSRDREDTHVSTRYDERYYANGGRYNRRTVKTTKTVTTTRKRIHG